MKTCPKCNELNGDNRTFCFRCSASLGPVDAYKKICTKCNVIYSQRTEICEDCGGRLSVYANDNYGTTYSGGSEGGCWMYVVSVLIPLVGIILGCIYIARQEDELGKSLIITGVVSNILAVILGIMLAGCSGF